MDTLIGPTVHYCCIWNGKKKIQLQNSGDYELEKLADLCLENKPPFHVWYLRTVKGRTYGILTEEGVAYFAIADSSISNQNIVSFLRHIRDGFKKSSRNGFVEELVPVVDRLIASLEGLTRQLAIDQITEVSSSECATSTKMPLLGRSASRPDGRKLSIRGIQMDDDRSPSSRRVDLDGSPEVIGGFSLQKNVSSNRLGNQINGHRWWLRQAKIIVAIDVLVCMVLFAVWLVICRGFYCVR